MRTLQWQRKKKRHDKRRTRNKTEKHTRKKSYPVNNTNRALSHRKQPRAPSFGPTSGILHNTSRSRQGSQSPLPVPPSSFPYVFSEAGSRSLRAARAAAVLQVGGVLVEGVAAESMRLWAAARVHWRVFEVAKRKSRSPSRSCAVGSLQVDRKAPKSTCFPIRRAEVVSGIMRWWGMRV